MTIDTCALDPIFDIILSVDSQEQDSEPCDQPTEMDYAFFVNSTLKYSEAVCNDAGVTLENSELDKATDDLVAIFSASECWGVDDCSEGPLVDPPTEPTDMIFVVTENGHQCIFERSFPEVVRELEIPFYYSVETSSADQEPSLEGIETTLIKLACSDDLGARKTRMLVEEEVIVVALDSYPEDVISTDCKFHLFFSPQSHTLPYWPLTRVFLYLLCLQYTDTCSPENVEAASCFVVEGKVTIVLEGNSTAFDEVITSEANYNIEQLFGFVPLTLGNPNIVDVKYIGPVPPSTTLTTNDAPDAPAAEAPAFDAPTKPVNDVPAKDAPANDEPKELPTIGNLNEGNEEDEPTAYTTLVIAASSVVVAMAVLISGFHRMNGKADDTGGSIQLDEKSNDGSNDGQSTAMLTFANSCDNRSEVSSLSSPVHSLDNVSHGAFSLDVHHMSPSKFFVVSEEEEAH